MGRAGSRRKEALDYGEPVRGTVDLAAGEVLRAVPFTWTSGRGFLCSLPVDLAKRYLKIPGDGDVRNPPLAISLCPGWSRSLRQTFRLAKLRPALAPTGLVLSSRSSWLFDGSYLHLHDTALVIDGAYRLASWALSGTATGDAPAVVLTGLSNVDELAVRNTFVPLGSSPSTQRGGPREQLSFGPADAVVEEAHGMDRITVSGTEWRTFTFLSEPFIVPTARGYGVATIVTEDGAGDRRLLYVGAKSLAVEIETHRRRQGFLAHARARLRKLAAESSAQYVIEFERP